MAVPPTSLTEEELERQYLAYKTQFEEWIEKNRHHPDRDAYSRYVKQFKEWEAQVEVNRQAIREWKKKSQGAGEVDTNLLAPPKKANEPTTSDASSPPHSATTEKKKKKKSKKKKATEDAVASAPGDENPMMAMMKMMASMAGPPLVPASPMDPMSMMMAMTMMMPLMMNTAPTPPSMPAARPESSAAVPVPTLPDVTAPPPGFSAPPRGFPAVGGDNPVQWKKQTERDRAFRADRAHRGTVPVRPERVAGRGQEWEQDGAERDRGDYWYQRWLSKRHDQPVPPPRTTVDPWLPTHRPPPSSQGAFPSPTVGPAPLWPPSTVPHQRMRMSLDRDMNRNYEGPQYVSRSNFGPRDFSMRKQHQRPWD